MASGPLIHEKLHPAQRLGIGLICAGVWAIGISGSPATEPGSPWWRLIRLDRGTGLALLTACAIATYTLIDGHGSRISEAPFAYTAWIFLLTAFPMVIQGVVLKPQALRSALRHDWWIGLLGGAGNIGAYGLVLWAMGRAPVATVAALREISILFATLIAVMVLHEKVSRGRLAGTAVILAGALTLRLT